MKITSKTFTRRSFAIPAGLAVAVAAAFGGIAIGNATKQAAPVPTSTPVAFVIPADMPINAAPVVADPETYDQVLADIAAKKAAADAAAAAQAAADAAAAKAAADALAARNAAHNVQAAPDAPHESGARNLPPGSAVPLLDAASGFYDISACASGHASGTPPVCD